MSVTRERERSVRLRGRVTSRRTIYDRCTDSSVCCNAPTLRTCRLHGLFVVNNRFGTCTNANRARARMQYRNALRNELELGGAATCIPGAAEWMRAHTFAKAARCTAKRRGRSIAYIAAIPH